MADSQRERQIEMVRRALNADLVEVVRCKDCKFWDEYFTDPITSYQYGFCNSDKWRDVEGWEQETNGQDFCSYGERKEQNG